jgi:hypothetical protein
LQISQGQDNIQKKDGRLKCLPSLYHA